MDDQEVKKLFVVLTHDLARLIDNIYFRMHEMLSDDWRSYTVVVGKHTFEFNPPTTEEDKKKLYRMRRKCIKLLLKDSLNDFVMQMDTPQENDFDRNNFSFSRLHSISSLKKKEDYQFEIIKEEIVSNLDENGKPITAKRLNMDSPYVKWQDQSQFKFEEDNE